jgi:hypothetical protein
MTTTSPTTRPRAPTPRTTRSGDSSRNATTARKCSRSCSRLSACGRSSCSGWWRWRSTRRSVAGKPRRTSCCCCATQVWISRRSFARASPSFCLALHTLRLPRDARRAPAAVQYPGKWSLTYIWFISVCATALRLSSSIENVTETKDLEISVTGYFTMQATGKCVFGRSRRRARLARRTCAHSARSALLYAPAREPGTGRTSFSPGWRHFWRSARCGAQSSRNAISLSLFVSTARGAHRSRAPRPQIMHNLMARERRYLEAVVRNQVIYRAPARRLRGVL